jgi:hypothetical protein
MWRFYENRRNEDSWIPPNRHNFPISVGPKFVAEDDSGVRIGTFGRKKYLANLVYQHADCCIYFYMGVNFTIDSNDAEIKTDRDVAVLMVGDIHAEAALTGEDKGRFLAAATIPSIYNQLFRMFEYELLTEIRIVRPSPSIGINLSQNPWRKNDQRD